MKQSDRAYQMHVEGGNMCFNRFCIDEDAAFELSGVHNLKKLTYISKKNLKARGIKV